MTRADDRPDWTDTDRLVLARYLQTAAEKQLDIRLTTHRASVLAAALLTGGWRRQPARLTSHTRPLLPPHLETHVIDTVGGRSVPRRIDNDDTHPRCVCGSSSVRSDIIVCVDCGRWQ